MLVEWGDYEPPKLRIQELAEMEELLTSVEEDEKTEEVDDLPANGG
jgi:hypothetical protein